MFQSQIVGTGCQAVSGTVVGAGVSAGTTILQGSQIIAQATPVSIILNILIYYFIENSDGQIEIRSVRPSRVRAPPLELYRLLFVFCHRSICHLCRCILMATSQFRPRELKVLFIFLIVIIIEISYLWILFDYRFGTVYDI